MPTTSMLLQFKEDPSRFAGGEAYAPGKDYVLGRFETCLWIKRDVIDMDSLRPGIDLTAAVLALSDGNLRPGHRLTLGEIVAALDELASHRRDRRRRR